MKNQVSIGSLKAREHKSIKQAEAEVVPSSSLVEIEVEVGVRLG